MKIETAGEQRFYDFVEDRMKKYRIIDISWISIICSSFVAMASGQEVSIFIGLMLLVFGVALGVKNHADRKALDKKLNVFDNRKKFFDQLVANTTVEFKDLKLMIANEFLLYNGDEFYVFKFCDLKTVEIENNCLYVVDTKRNRYKLAENEKGNENSFDTACQLLAILI